MEALFKMMFDFYERESNRWWNYWTSYEERVGRLQSSYLTVLMDIMMRMFPHHSRPITPPYMISPPIMPMPAVDPISTNMTEALRMQQQQQQQQGITATNTMKFDPETLKDMIDYIVAKREKEKLEGRWDSRKEGGGIDK